MSTFTTTPIEALFPDDAWLHRLACRLVSNSHAAQDLVQRAKIATIQKPPADGVSLDRWIAGIMRKLALYDFRKERTRRSLERVASRTEEFAESADVSLQRLETQQLVIQAVTELDEPYRTAIIARFIDDVPVRTIVERSGTPRKTIESRIERGLSKLRENLDRKHGGDRERWELALGPFLTHRPGTWDWRYETLGRSPAKVAIAVAVVVPVLLMTFVGLWRDADTQTADAVAFLSHRELKPETAVASMDSAPQRVAETGSIAFAQVRVVHSASRQPVPDATVSWWPFPAGTDCTKLVREWFRSGTLEEHTKDGLQSVRTDDQGRAWIPPSQNGSVAFAAHGELWGMLIVPTESTSDEHILEVREDYDIRVRVREQGLSPLPNVRVQLRELGPCEGGRFNVEYLYATTSSADGTGVLRHVGYVKNSTNSACEAVARIYACVAGVEASHVEVDFNDPPTDPVDIIIDCPIGACTIELADSAGRPVDGPLYFIVKAGSRSWTEPKQDGDRCAFEWSGGRATVLAPLDKELAFYVSENDRNFIQYVVQGPKARDDDLHVFETWIPPAETPQHSERKHGESRAAGVIRGSVVNEHGVPLANAPLGIACQDSSVRHTFDLNLVKTRTDDSGRFSLRLEDLLSDDIAGEASVFVLCLGTDQQPRASARIDMEFIPGTVELGQCRLQPLPAILGGQIVDTERHHVVGATVTVFTEEGTHSVFDLSAESDSSDLLGSPITTPNSYRPVFETLSGLDGRFEFLATSDTDQDFVVRVRKSGFGHAIVRLRSQTNDAEIVLDSPGSIAGTVLIDSSLRQHAVYARATRREASVSSNSFNGDLGVAGVDYPLLREDGTFEIRDLEPGMYSVSIVSFQNGSDFGGFSRAPPHSEVFRVEDIEVVAGKTTQDARLRLVDLRSSLRSVNVYVRDLAGQPIPGAVVLLSNGQVTRCDSAGHSRVIGSPNSVRARVRSVPEFGYPDSHRYVPRDIEIGRADVTVELRRYPQVRIVLDDDIDALPADFSLETRLNEVIAGEKSNAANWNAFDETATADISLDYEDEATHLVEVELRLTRYSEEGTELGTRRLNADETPSILVGPAEVQVFSIAAPSRDIFETALRELAASP